MNTHSRRPLVGYGVPIDCLGMSGPLAGTERAPDVLRSHGFFNALNIKDGGNLNVRISSNRRDQSTGIIGYSEVCHITHSVRSVVSQTIRGGKRPFLVGGCCTQVIGAYHGATDALKRAGLVYVDGHIDLYTGKTSPTGEAADMPVAFLLGHDCPAGLSHPTPLLPENLHLIGCRDLEEASGRGSLLPIQIPMGLCRTPDDIHRFGGPAALGRKVAEIFEEAVISYWLHVDFDVLKPQEFSATDYLMPGGLTWQELVALLKPIAQCPKLAGVSIACYNPDKDDAQMTCAQQIVQNLATVF